jgi:hypothetical protein
MTTIAERLRDWDAEIRAYVEGSSDTDTQTVLRDAADALDAAEKALGSVMTELWWCANQLGCNWKDDDWRSKSSVGRAYDAAVAARANLRGTK